MNENVLNSPAYPHLPAGVDAEITEALSAITDAIGCVQGAQRVLSELSLQRGMVESCLREALRELQSAARDLEDTRIGRL